MDRRPTWTDCDEAGDYYVPNVLSPWDLVFRPDNIDYTRHLGPVVQSIVSLTMSLRRQLVKYMWTTLSNMLLFFVGKM